MKKKEKLKLFLWLAVAVPLTITSCKKEYTELKDEDGTTVPRTVYGDFDIPFSWANGYYTSARALSNFGNISGYTSTEIDRSYITNGTLRVKIIKNAYSSGSGVVTKVDIADHSAYKLTFDVKFHSDFDWGDGGKMGWGLLLGDGFTGGDDASGGTGGSLRPIWGTPGTSTTEAYIQPYAYYVDMPSTYGNGFGVRYPAKGQSLQRATWYSLELIAQANTYTNYNGKIKFSVNGTVLYEDNTFRWTTVHSKRKVNYLSQSVFRGGTAGSESSTDGWLYFDNLKLDWFSAQY